MRLIWTRKKNPLNNQMPLDWLQKAVSGGVHSARWLPTETRASLQEECHSPKVEFLAWSWGPCDKGLKGLGGSLWPSPCQPHIKLKCFLRTYLPLHPLCSLKMETRSRLLRDASLRFLGRNHSICKTEKGKHVQR